MSDAELADLFYEAAVFLTDRVRADGWKKFSSNYLREHVRCRHGVVFGNSRSPAVLRELLRRHPELADRIELGTLTR